MKKIFLAIALAVVVVLVAAAMTTPDYKAHYAAVKGTALHVIDHEVNANPWTALFGPMVTMGALDVVDAYLKKNLLFYDHTFYTTGVLIYKDQFIPVSVGAFGHVHMLVSEDDIKNVVKLPDLQQLKN